MVVETEIKSFLEWFLGESWSQGALWHSGALVACLLGLAAVFILFCAVARFRPQWVGNFAGGAVVTLLALLGIVILVAAPVGLGVLIGWTAPWEAIKPIIGRAGGGFMAWCNWALGGGWTGGVVCFWLAMAVSLVTSVLLVAWVVLALRSGPRSAVGTIRRMVTEVTADVAGMSFRRVFALSWLAVKESIRRRVVVVVFLLFTVVLLFAGWFLDPTSDRPARLYLDFVLTWATGYPVLLLVLFLSAWSLPADIKSRTLHTVVTKPVRASEILLGRVVGFGAMGTLLLLVMGLVSYVFVVRGLDHRHEIPDDQLARAVKQWKEQAARGEPGKPVKLRTTKAHGHRHTFYLNPLNRGESDGKPSVEVLQEGRINSEMEQGHWHGMEYEIEGDLSGAEAALACDIASPEGRLVARVPLYGKLRFLDRSGKEAEKGVNTGDEWSYRSFLEGGRPAAAIWEFDGIRQEDFPNGLPLELNIEVFRTYKGDTSDPEKIAGVTGSIALRNPDTGKKVDVRIFTAKDFAVDLQQVPRKIEVAEGEFDLFKDLITEDGRTEVWLQCITPRQYFGVAQADLYIRSRDASFPLNFCKGYVGVWLQMMMVIVLGTVLSSFLSAPIAIVATAGVLVGGFFTDFMSRLAVGDTYGGGPVESFVRLLTQQNVVEEMEQGMRTTVVQSIDLVAQGFLWVASAMLPAFQEFNFARYVAYGYDVSGTTLSIALLRMLAFLLPVFLAGCFLLKTREVAR